MITLETLVDEAKKSPETAGQKLLPLVQEIFPGWSISELTIQTSKVSLNSINGTVMTNGGVKFFKFHAEKVGRENAIGREYYQAGKLADLGWPLIRPVAVNGMPGRQCVLYPLIEAPTVYDLMGEEDALFMETGHYGDKAKLLLQGEKQYLEDTTALLLCTLQPGTPDNAQAPLHELFSDRLHRAGETAPRLEEFYLGKPVPLPDGHSMSFDELAKLHWVINRIALPFTLAEILDLCKKLLNKNNMAMQPSCFSHGDDHNGNKFLIDGKFVAFDPAFAGRHPVLLGLIKGVMHNGPLHPFWYYEPERVLPRLKMDFAIEDGRLHVGHNGEEILKSPLRQEVYQLHAHHAFHPVLEQLAAQNQLWDGWQDFLRCAAFACPFLALNMINLSRGMSTPSLPAKLALFNLAECVALFHNAADVLIPEKLRS
jgi:hypothetical protein